jgi:hypothetical protein
MTMSNVSLQLILIVCVLNGIVALQCHHGNNGSMDFEDCSSDNEWCGKVCMFVVEKLAANSLLKLVQNGVAQRGCVNSDACKQDECVASNQNLFCCCNNDLCNSAPSSSLLAVNYLVGTILVILFIVCKAM